MTPEIAYSKCNKGLCFCMLALRAPT